MLKLSQRVTALLALNPPIIFHHVFLVSITMTLRLGFIKLLALPLTQSEKRNQQSETCIIQ
jgi:hypothetical protein